MLNTVRKIRGFARLTTQTLQDFLTGVTYLNLRGIPVLSLSQESLWIGFHREQGKNLTHREEGKSPTQNFYMVN